MQRLLLEGTARVRWEETGDPGLAGPDGAIVRPVAVATCDLDVAVLAGRYPLAGPYPFGHEGVADVVEVGGNVATVAPGDRVGSRVIHLLPTHAGSQRLNRLVDRALHQSVWLEDQ